MKRDIPYVLMLLLQGLEERKLEKAPMDSVLAYVGGDLQFLIESLAEEYLSEEQQEQIKTVLDHHWNCVYKVQARIKYRLLPLSERALLERPLE